MLEEASRFIDTHARLIERRRFHLLFGDGGPEGVLSALAGYANADGGFGWGLEPDLRSPRSQPAGALHAFEFLAEIAPAISPLAVRLCDWLESITLVDGGVPFSLPGAGGPGVAPWFAGADPMQSSLHMTCIVCEAALDVAAHDAAVAGHPWLERARDFCLREIATIDTVRSAYEFKTVLRLLDALGAGDELERLAPLLPDSATLPVAGGIEGETLKPLDISPLPDRPLRELIDPEVIARDVERLRADQREDGGWEVDFATQSPAAALEWRGYATVGACRVLRANGAA